VARVRLGKIVRAVGLRGHLGVAGSDGALGRLKRVWLAAPGSAPEEFEVVEARAQGRLWAVRLEGISDRAASERWVGAEVLAERGDLGEAGPGRHYWADLEGLPVVTVDGRPLGTVSGLLETGGVDVLVATGAGREVLIPLAPYVTVDAAAGRIVVDPPDGLLDAGTDVGEEGGPQRGR
jgi:16S rRNA processing protein RimM